MAKELIQKVRTQGLPSLLCPKFLRLPRPRTGCPGVTHSHSASSAGELRKRGHKEKNPKHSQGRGGGQVTQPRQVKGPSGGGTGGPRGSPRTEDAPSARSAHTQPQPGPGPSFLRRCSPTEPGASFIAAPPHPPTLGPASPAPSHGGSAAPAGRAGPGSRRSSLTFRELQLQLGQLLADLAGQRGHGGGRGLGHGGGRGCGRGSGRGCGGASAAAGRGGSGSGSGRSLRHG